MEALADSAMEIEKELEVDYTEAIHEGFVGSDQYNKHNIKFEELEKLAITETAGIDIHK